MKAEAGQPGTVSRTGESLPYRVAPRWRTVATDKNPVFARPAPHVLRDERQDMRRDRHSPLPSIRLGIRIERYGRLKQLHPVPPDRDRTSGQIDVGLALTPSCR